MSNTGGSEIGMIIYLHRMTLICQWKRCRDLLGFIFKTVALTGHGFTIKTDFH